MLRPTYLLFLSTLVPACAAKSQSLGAGESSTDASSSSAEDTQTTGDDGVCEQLPEFSCTVPYDGSFGPCGSEDFDANCCMRPSCNANADCDDGEACALIGNNGLECHDEEVDGETICACSANPGGFPAGVCMPIAELPA